MSTPSQKPKLIIAPPNPEHFYLNNQCVKRSGVRQVFTTAEADEYLRCMDNPAYFVKNYVKIISLDKGLIPFELYPYQEKMFEHFEKNRFSIVLAPRQSGKSISCVGYILWYSLFKPDKTIAILANKGATAREMLSRITLALENIPFFLQPGCKALNKGSIEFDGNTKIFAAATTGSSIRGRSCSLLYLDEFAFVENSAEFYTSTYPVVTSGTSTKVIITSTPRGIGNMFHSIWENATQGVNEYKPFRVYWNDVPGRDDAWKQQTIANTSELQWRQEFEGAFIGTGSTLINAETLLGLKAAVPIYTQNNARIYARPISDHNYVLIADVAKGRGQDFSTFSIIDISVQPFAQVATFRDNAISPLLFPNIIYKYAKTYNSAYVIVESNDSGSVVCNGLYYDLEYENMFVESAVSAGAIGITTTKKNKRIGCSNLKDLLEEGKLVITDADTIMELSTFEESGSSYEASESNHDDCVMPLVLFSWFICTDIFGHMSSVNLKGMLYSDRMKSIEDELVPVGSLGNGDPIVELKNKYELDDNGNAWMTVEPDNQYN